MILQALNSYYERLEADPETDIAPYGFSRQKISFAVVLEPDGTLVRIEDLREEIGKKLLARSLVVCGGAKPSGSGINPCFLWDNPAYMLGFKPDDTKPKRTLESFEAFRDRHVALEADIGDPEFSAVCRFLEQWNPEDAPQHERLVDIGTGFGVFQIQMQKHFVHERDAVNDWWLKQIAPQDDGDSNEQEQCLVTGKDAAIARVHEPKIKGVSGAQSAGAAIVSFNFTAVESYGKEQSFNAPVSERATFQYCTALNRLLADRNRRVQMGDTTVVFWTEQPDDVAIEAFGMVLGNPEPEDEETLAKVRASLLEIAQGGYPDEFGDREAKFYVLGLSPNAARISVRFWLVSTLGEMVEKTRQHLADLELSGRSDRDPSTITPWHIMRETARDSKDIPPLLAGSLARSMITGQPYPQMLLAAIVRRIRADRRLPYVRIAVIKACLNRNSRFGIHSLKKEIAMSLDPERDEPAYHLGRLFAELEKAQKDALPGINDTIKDRYFGAASATPGSVFPRLIRMNQHHLSKLEVGGKTYREKRIQAICGHLTEFPGHLNLNQQGLFAIGYYHQVQDIYAKKTTNETETTDSATNDEE